MMKKVFFDVFTTGDYLGSQPMSIGLLADTGETFYGEVSDYEYNRDFVQTVVDQKQWFKFTKPGRGENEYWTWSKGNFAEMRGTKQVIGRYVTDWLHAILGGAVGLSWIDYSKKSGGPGYQFIKPVIDVPSVEFWGIKIFTKWQQLCSLWGEGIYYAPKCIYSTPYDVETLIRHTSTKYEGMDAIFYTAIEGAKYVKGMFDHTIEFHVNKLSEI